MTQIKQLEKILNQITSKTKKETIISTLPIITATLATFLSSFIYKKTNLPEIAVPSLITGTVTGAINYIHYISSKTHENIIEKKQKQLFIPLIIKAYKNNPQKETIEYLSKLQKEKIPNSKIFDTAIEIIYNKDPKNKYTQYKPL